MFDSCGAAGVRLEWHGAGGMNERGASGSQRPREDLRVHINEACREVVCVRVVMCLAHSPGP